MTKNKVIEDNKTITIDEVIYDYDDFTDHEKIIISHIESLSKKIDTTGFDLDQLKVGQDAFIAMLKKSISEKDKSKPDE